MRRLILGSQSPRRREVLSAFALPFEQRSPPFSEEGVPYEGDPDSYAATQAEGKAASLQAEYPDALILTADTVVSLDGEVYGKPKDEVQAFQFLQTLQGKWHQVHTGVALADGGKITTRTATSRVKFHTLNNRQIRAYITHAKWSDKAGSYGIQLPEGLIVEKIEGCYYNVLGLPLGTVQELLLTAGIDLWDYLK